MAKNRKWDKTGGAGVMVKNKKWVKIEDWCAFTPDRSHDRHMKAP